MSLDGNVFGNDDDGISRSRVFVGKVRLIVPIRGR